jgi:gluconolactonase
MRQWCGGSLILGSDFLVDSSRYPPSDEVFFVQNAGAVDAGTGLNKSNSIYKISLQQAAAVSGQQNASGQVDVVKVNADPPVINSNGRSA